MELLRELGRTSDSVSTATYPVIANMADELAIMGLSPAKFGFALRETDHSGGSMDIAASLIDGFASVELLRELGRTE